MPNASETWPAGRRVTAAPTSGGRAGSSEDVRSLLRQRLILVGTLASSLLSMPLGAAVVGLTGPGDNVLGPLEPSLSAQIALVGIIGFGYAVAVFLWRRPALSLTTLRKIEVVYLLVVAGSFMVFRMDMTGDALEHSPGTMGVHWVGSNSGFAWQVLIVMFGVVLPQTWRGAAVRVLTLSAGTLTVDVVLMAACPPGTFSRLIPLTMFSLPPLIFGVTVTLFGTAKMAELRERVRAAEKEAAAARAVGPYELTRKLGQGGMGEVWLAEHRLLKRPCAVKLIRPEGADNPATIARFDREVKATAALRHPNTVEVYDYGRAADGAFYYVMEYLNGLPLDTVVDKYGPLPPGRVIYLLKQVCGALEEAHAAGLVHRDIKPANLMVCRVPGAADAAKLLDFGLTRAAAGPDPALTTAGVVVGTPYYMAPEQSSGDVDLRADIYALGATAFHLLAGRPPFDRPSALDVVLAHRTDPVPSFADVGANVPESLESVIRRCLMKDPELRYESAGQLRSALGRCRDVRAWTDADATAWWEVFVDAPAGEPTRSQVMCNS